MPHGASSEAEDPRRHVAVEPGRVDERRAHVGAGHVVAGGREEEGLAAVEERLDEVAVHEHAQLNGGPVQRVAELGWHRGEARQVAGCRLGEVVADQHAVRLAGCGAQGAEPEHTPRGHGSGHGTYCLELQLRPRGDAAAAAAAVHGPVLAFAQPAGDQGKTLTFAHTKSGCLGPMNFVMAPPTTKILFRSPLPTVVCMMHEHSSGVKI